MSLLFFLAVPFIAFGWMVMFIVNTATKRRNRPGRSFLIWVAGTLLIPAGVLVNHLTETRPLVGYGLLLSIPAGFALVLVRNVRRANH